jgi:hypothetical protein
MRRSGPAILYISTVPGGQMSEGRATQATGRAGIVPYNPFAFPPLHLDVQVSRSTGRARAAILGGQMLEVRTTQEQLPS